MPVSQWVRSDEENATLFAEYLAEIFTPNNDEPDDEIERNLVVIPEYIPPLKIVTPNKFGKKLTS